MVIDRKKKNPHLFSQFKHLNIITCNYSHTWSFYMSRPLDCHGEPPWTYSLLSRWPKSGDTCRDILKLTFQGLSLNLLSFGLSNCEDTYLKLSRWYWSIIVCIDTMMLNSQFIWSGSDIVGNVNYQLGLGI